MKYITLSIHITFCVWKQIKIHILSTFQQNPYKIYRETNLNYEKYKSVFHIVQLQKCSSLGQLFLDEFLIVL